MGKEYREEYDNAEIGFDNYFDKWPNWLRWISFIPAALIIYLVMYYLGYFSMYWFYGDTLNQGFIWNTYRDIIFVMVPLYVIHECVPKYKFVLSTIFASIYIIIGVVGLTLNLVDGLLSFNLESFFSYMLPQILAIGTSVCFIVIAARNKFNIN